MQQRVMLPWIFAASPVLLFLLTWDTGDGLSAVQGLMRTLALPVMVVQLFLIAVAAIEKRLLSTAYVFKTPWVWIPLGTLFLTSVGDAFLVSPNQEFALFRTYFWVTQLLFGWAVASMAEDRFSPKVWIDAMLVTGTAIVALTFLFSYLVPQDHMDWYYGFPMVSHIRHLGYYLTAISALGLALICIETLWSKRWWLAFTATSASFVLQFWTGSRGAMLAAIVAFIVCLVLVPAMRRAQTLFSLATLALGGVVSLLFPVPAPHMGILQRLLALIEDQSGSLTTGRDILWLKNIDVILARPFFGYGDGQMRGLVDHAGTVQPHQVLLQVLLAWGLVGFVSLTIVSWPVVQRSISRARSGSADVLAPFLTVVSLAVYAMYDGTLYHPLSVALFSASLALILRPDRQSKDAPAS